MGMPKDRDARAADLVRRLPSAPTAVVARMQAHLKERDFPVRGLVAVMEDFYAALATAGSPPEEVTAGIFEGVATSRSRLRALLWGLAAFDPTVPLAPAASVTQAWDRWLNARYNQKPRKPRLSTRIAASPEDWPDSWQQILPTLDRTVRPHGEALRPPAPRTREAIIQAVGMLATARIWARERDVDLPEHPSADLIEAFNRYLANERAVSPVTIVSYLERVRMLFLRGGLLDSETDAEISELIGLNTELATEQDPAKRRIMTAFRRQFSIGILLHQAVAAAEAARALPGCRTEALRLRQKSVAYGLLLNTADRQGDLRHLRIGVDLLRDASGVWRHDLRQSKTSVKKPLGPLWPVTCALIDAHLLADRPVWQVEARYAELQGCNLLTLSETALGETFINRRLAVDLALSLPNAQISGHLVRTLVTDAIRRARPDAAWAAQQMLGHSDRWMQETYRSDFVEAGAVHGMGLLIDKLATGT